MSGLRTWLSTGSALLRGVARLDLGLCVLVALFATLAATGTRSVSLLAGLTGAAFALPLLWRQKAPLAALAAFPLGVGFNAIFAHEGVRCGAAIPAALILLYSGGARLDRRRALIGLALGQLGVAVEDLTDPRLDAATLVVLLPLCAGAWLAGRIVSSRIAVARELEERTQLLELRREQTAQLAVQVDRVRIAADLDAVASSRVGEIVDLARSGEAEIAGGSGDIAATFGQIERRSRATLDQIRGLLGALRSDGSAPHDPQPSLDELDDLLKDARDGERAVRVEVEGRRRALPASVELSAYRIIQETLAAMDRGSEVSVRLRYRDDALELEVLGHCRAMADRDPSVVALRQRALLHGGTLAVTSARTGTRAFHARLPLIANNG